MAAASVLAASRGLMRGGPRALMRMRSAMSRLRHRNLIVLHEWFCTGCELGNTQDTQLDVWDLVFTQQDAGGWTRS